jgi:hypothetical protein
MARGSRCSKAASKEATTMAKNGQHKQPHDLAQDILETVAKARALVEVATETLGDEAWNVQLTLETAVEKLNQAETLSSDLEGLLAEDAR